MALNISHLFESLYQTIVPKPIQSRLTPRLIRVYIFLMKTTVLNRKRKRISRVDIRITDHCNLNCKSCSQLSPLAKPKCIDSVVFTNDLLRLCALTNGNIRTIYLLGGEPLLHHELLKLLQAARQIFCKSRIVLVTNGILLAKQSENFWNVCSNYNIEISISHYPITIDYRALLAIASKHNVNLSYATRKPQTMSKWAFDVEGRQNSPKNFFRCYYGNNCIQVDSGKLYNCAYIPVVKHFNRYFNKNMQITSDDYIDIYKPDVNLCTILKFLTAPVPFCRYCNIDRVQYGEKWALSGRDIREWT